MALEVVESRPLSSSGVGADVWLTDGHSGALDVAEPVVAAVHEVGWTTRELRRFLQPGFAAQIGAGTGAGVLAAAHVLAPSQSSRSQVLDAFAVDAERVHMVPYGVDTSLFRPGLAGGRARVDAVSLSASAPYVLFVGSLHPRKNLAALRKAMAALARRGFQHVLALVAAEPLDRDDRSDLRRMGEAELPGVPGRIVSIPSAEDAELAALMAGADAVCLPSFSEGFGLPVLEAMACGTPTVVSDRGALPELVGSAGLVVSPTAKAVEEALAGILSDAALAGRLGAAARRRAQGFTWERTADGWLHALERAAGEKHDGLS